MNNNKEKAYVHEQIPKCALRAVLGEIWLTNKPGLVDRYTKGAHDDMDYSTFMKSIPVLSQGFKRIPLLKEIDDIKEVNVEIRKINREIVEKMMKATGNVNTQKGLVILLNFSIFVAVKTLLDKGSYDIDYLREMLRYFGQNVDKKRESGIIFELQNSFKTTFEDTLPLLRKRLDIESLPFTRDVLNFALREIFVKYIQKTKDGCIIRRKGEGVLLGLQELAKEYFEQEGAREKEDIYKKMTEYCIKHWVSPGGSADLISIALFFYYLERTWPIKEDSFYL